MTGLDTHVRAADFADCLIERIASGAGFDMTLSFDAGAVRAAGMTLVS